MDPSYAMAKFGLESKDILKSRQKGCWHYMKYFFIFSSIIQFLIILGLVLFMLYGNAHGGTELRLKTVENRYKALTLEHAWLNGNFSLLKQKIASTEKDLKNCSDFVVRLRAITMVNRTVPCPRFPTIPNCNYIQASLEHLNMTCITERLKADNYKMLHEFKFSQYKDNCSKAMTEYVNKERFFSSENTQLQRDKKDLITQTKLLQESCTTIDERFKRELQNLENLIEASLKPDLYTTRTCKPLTETITNRIDATLIRLRQDVNSVMYENSQIRVTKDRVSEDLLKCNQDKGLVTAERNNLAAEKDSLVKQLGDNKDELNKSYSRYIKKEEELESCRRTQMRPPGFPPLRP